MWGMEQGIIASSVVDVVTTDKLNVKVIITFAQGISGAVDIKKIQF